MEKKSVTKILIWAVLLSVLVNIFFSRWLTARISTLPWLNRLNLLSPQAPIVFRETQEVRISPEGDVNDALQKLRSRLSQVGIFSKNQFTVLGSAINFTSDGLFLTSSLVLPKTGQAQILLSDGRLVEVTQNYTDPATGLAFLKTGLRSLAPASLSTANLRLGDRILFFSDSAEGGRYFETQVNFLPKNISEPFGFQNTGIETRPSVVVANYKGEVLALWHDRLLTADQFKTAFENYLKTQRQ